MCVWRRNQGSILERALRQGSAEPDETHSDRAGSRVCVTQEEQPSGACVNLHSVSFALEKIR